MPRPDGCYSGRSVAVAFGEIAAPKRWPVGSIARALHGSIVPCANGLNNRTGATVGERHGALLDRARLAMNEAQCAWQRGVEGELVTIDLREALAALDEILGLGPNEAVIDRIFEQFCLGK